jgi:serine/threonine-protein kinase RsbW
MNDEVDEVVVRLSFPAKPDYLLLARLALAGLARSLSAQDEVVADLKLAVTEACGNAVRHAYGDRPGDVVVSYVLRDDGLEIVVEDCGRGLGAEEPATSESVVTPDGGMGMAIIRTIVDELVVETGADGTGTVIRMTKRLAPGQLG